MNWDVCVIGAGAGGLMAASELAAGGKKVVVLEKGPRYDRATFPLLKPTWETEPLPFREPEYTSGPGRPARILAVQGVGGSTLRYQAVMRRMTEPWAPAEMYDRVEKKLGVRSYPLSYAAKFTRLPWKPTSVAIRPSCVFCAGCAYGCAIGAKVSADTLPLDGVEIIPEAAVFRFDDAAHYRDRDGREHRVEAKTFVLAAGALETPRLLRLSGLSAGRGIMESLTASVTVLCDERLGSYRGIPIEAMMEEDGFIVGLSQSVIGLLGPLSYAKRLAPMTRPHHAEWMKRHYGSALGIYASAGQASRPENVVTLDEKKDRFGVPLPRIESRLDDADRAVIEKMKRRLETLAAAIPGARVVERRSSLERGPGGAELRGGCATLVDEHGRVRGVDRLYIADASVFPTPGPGNPSLTIMALAARTARHILRGG